MKKTTCATVATAAVLLSMTAAAADGDRWSNATALTAKTTAQSKTVTCVNKYDADNDGSATGEPVYYFKIQLSKGTPLKVWADESDEINSIEAVLAGDDPDYHFETIDDYTLVLRSSVREYEYGCWSEEDPESLNFYILAHGDGYWDANYDDNGNFKGWKSWDSGEIGHGVPKVTLHWQIVDYEEPKGSYENPERIDDISTTVEREKLNRVEPYVGGGYYFVARLTAGNSYVFYTTSGTAANPASMSAPGGYDTADPENSDYAAAPEYNNGYIVTPSVTGDYIFSAESDSGTVSIKYGGSPVLLPAQHDWTGLECGVAASFTPGLMSTNGYADTVIDDRLFRFAASAGRRYVCRTAGAQCDIEMRIYDEAGATLAANTGIGGGNHDAVSAVEAPADGYLYVGVCERFNGGYEGVPTGKSCTITVVDVETCGYEGDVFDPADDETAGATAVVPVVTADASLSPAAASAAEGPHTLGIGDWADAFALQLRSGFVCKIGAATNAVAEAGVRLKAAVVRIAADGTETEVAASGDAANAGSATGCLTFTADADGLYAVRLSTAIADGTEAPGLAWPEYTLHAIAYKSDAAEYGTLAATQKGLTAADESEARWGLGSGGDCAYRYGTAVPAKDGETVCFSEVDGFAQPSSKTVSVTAGSITECMGVYNDEYDPGDDAMSGATAISVPAGATNRYARTLFAAPAGGGEDVQDWFSFPVETGVYYNFAIADAVRWDGIDGGDFEPSIAAYDENGNEIELDARNGFATFGAAAAGTCHVCVAPAASAPDCSYSLACWATDVGTVRFVSADVQADSGDAYAEVQIFRTSSGGYTAVDWMTWGGDALPGVDYCAADGRVEWEDGDSSPKTIRVKLIPPAGGHVAPRSFSVRAVEVSREALAGVGDDYYPAVVAAPGTATVTIGEFGTATGGGTVGFTAYGGGRTAFADPAYPEITVAPGTPVKLWVEREGGCDGEAEVEVSFISRGAASAIAAAETGRIAWGDGESGAKSVGLVVGNINGDGETIDIYAKLSVAADGYDLENPALGATLVAIHVDTSLEPYSAESDDTAEAGLATGTFLGVLDEASGVLPAPAARLAKVELSAASGGLSATVWIGGAEYSFTADGWEEKGAFRVATLHCESLQVAGQTGSATLAVELYDGAAATLETAAHADYATLAISLPSGDFEISGRIYRDNSSAASVANVLASYAGTYNVALVSPFETTNGVSTLRMGIDETGGAAVAGVLGDGTDFAATSRAYLVGSTLYSTNCVEIPLYAAKGGEVFGGTLRILPGEEADAGYADETCVLNVNSANRASQFIPIGGFYATNTLLQTKIPECGLVAVAEALGEAGIEVEICGDALFPADGNLSIAFDPATGAFSGEYAGMELSGLFAPVQDPEGDSGIVAFGRIAAADGARFFALAKGVPYSTTEDREIEVGMSFDGNGNTGGEAPEGYSGLVPGETVVLPEPGADFVCGSLEFAGWSDGAAFYLPGESYEMSIFDVEMSAVWSAATDGFAEALGGGLSGVTFLSPEEAPWRVDGEKLRSGAIGNGKTSELNAIVNGKGLLTFKWMTSCDLAGLAGAIFLVDGEEVARLDRSVSWTTVSVALTKERSTLTWRYWKSSSAISSGQDAAFLANLSISGGARQRARITLNLRGGSIEGSTELTNYVGEVFGELPEPLYSGGARSFTGWTDEYGVAVTATNVIESTDVHLFAGWLCAVSFDGNGSVSGEVPATIYGEPGGKVVLPGAGTLSKGDGYAFTGWSDGETTYLPGAEFEIPEGNTTLAAVWEPDFAAVSDGTAKPTFATGGTLEWFVASGEAANGGVALRSGAIGNSSSSWMSATVVGEGVFEFDWKVSCDTPATFANGYYAVNGERMETLHGIANDWRHVTLSFYGGTNIILWTFAKGSRALKYGDDCVRVAHIVWTPAAPVDFSGVVVTEETTMAVLGVTNAAFAADAAGSAAVTNLVAWAKANGATVADVNAMEFTAAGEPENTLAKAYLLGCAPTEAAVEEAAAEFKVTSISVDGEGNVTLVPADGSAYGNGRVEARYSATPAGEYTAAKPDGATCFIRLYLVK